MCGMSRAGAGGAGRGGGSERDGKFVLRSRGGGWGLRGRRRRGPQGGRAPAWGGGASCGRPQPALVAAHPEVSGPWAAPGLPAPGHPSPHPLEQSFQCALHAGPYSTPQSPSGLWGSGLGGAEGGAPASGAGLPSVPGLGCRVTSSPAEPGRTGLGVPYPHPSPEQSRQSALSRPWARPPTPGAPDGAPPWRLRLPCPNPVCLVLPERLVSRISPFPPLPGPPGPSLSAWLPGALSGGRLDTASPPSFGRTRDGRVGGDAAAPGAWARAGLGRWGREASSQPSGPLQRRTPPAASFSARAEEALRLLA